MTISGAMGEDGGATTLSLADHAGGRGAGVVGVVGGVGAVGKDWGVDQVELSPAVKLPGDLGVQATYVGGIRKSGKTNTGVVIVEEVARIGQQCVIVDPTDVWWGVRASAKAVGETVPAIIIGGRHGDIPLVEKPGIGIDIANAVIDSGASVVVSVRHLPKKAQRRVVSDLLEQLYLRNATDNRPVLVVLDEASTFIPQNTQGESARCVGAVTDVVRKGRASGLGALLIDQRPASVNKDALTQVDCMVIHRLTSPQDRKAIREWVEEQADTEQLHRVTGSLASLDTGEAWVWSPQWAQVFERTKINHRRTFDSSETPRHGHAPKVPAHFSPVDHRDFLRILEASASARNPATKPGAESGKRTGRGAGVESRISAAPGAMSSGTGEAGGAQAAGITEEQIAERITIARMEASRATVTMLDEANRAALLECERTVGRALSALRDALDKNRKALLEFAGARSMKVQGDAGRAPPTPATPIATDRGGATPSTARIRHTDGPIVGDARLDKLTGPSQRLLYGLIQLHHCGISPCENLLGLWCKIKPSGGHFANSMGPLISGGWVEREGTSLRPTSHALGAMEPSNTPGSINEYHERVALHLTGPERRILACFTGDPECPVVTPEAIERATGIKASGGHFANSIGRLVRANLVYRRDGGFRGSAFLFPPKLVKSSRRRMAEQTREARARELRGRA